MLIYKIPTDVKGKVSYTIVPSDKGSRVEVSIDLFQRMSQEYSDFGDLLEACYKRQIQQDTVDEDAYKSDTYKVAVEQTIKEFNGNKTENQL